MGYYSAMITVLSMSVSTGFHSCEFYSALAANDHKYGFTGQDDAGVTNADLALNFFNPGTWIRVVGAQV